MNSTLTAVLQQSPRLGQELLDAGVLGNLPKLARSLGPDPVVHLRFYSPDSALVWLATEGSVENGEFRFWGPKLGPYDWHWGYFTVSELETKTGPEGDLVVRDTTFTPRLVSEILELRDTITQVPEDARDEAHMSVNRALNAVIAMLEDRPRLFKELLRSPGSNVGNITEVESRLRQAVDRHAATQVRVGLMRTLHVLPPDGWPQEAKDAFIAGVRATEEVFEQLEYQLAGEV